jgi:hypothetical protein
MSDENWPVYVNDTTGTHRDCSIDTYTAYTCPRCGDILDYFDFHEGGWCSKCQVWWPADRVLEAMEEDR